MQVGRVDVEADDVDGNAAPADRYLHAVDETQAQSGSLGTRFGQAANLVVIGERKNIDAVAHRAPHQFGRREQAVGRCRVAMQVIVGQGLHRRAILACARAPARTGFRPRLILAQEGFDQCGEFFRLVMMQHVSGSGDSMRAQLAKNRPCALHDRPALMRMRPMVLDSAPSIHNTGAATLRQQAMAFLQLVRHRVDQLVRRIAAQLDRPGIGLPAPVLRQIQGALFGQARIARCACARRVRQNRRNVRKPGLSASCASHLA